MKRAAIIVDRGPVDVGGSAGVCGTEDAGMVLSTHYPASSRLLPGGVFPGDEVVVFGRAHNVAASLSRELFDLNDKGHGTRLSGSDFGWE